MEQAHPVLAHIRHTNIILHPSSTIGPYIYSGPMAALYDFGRKFGRKIDQKNFWKLSISFEIKAEGN